MLDIIDRNIWPISSTYIYIKTARSLVYVNAVAFTKAVVQHCYPNWRTRWPPKITNSTLTPIIRTYYIWTPSWITMLHHYFRNCNMYLHKLETKPVTLIYRNTCLHTDRYGVRFLSIFAVLIRI